MELMTIEEMYKYIEENSKDLDGKDIILNNYDIDDIFYGYSDPNEIKERLDELIDKARNFKFNK